MRAALLATLLLVLGSTPAWADGIGSAGGDPTIMDGGRDGAGLRGGTAVGLGDADGDGELDLDALLEANAPRLKDIGSSAACASTSCMALGWWWGSRRLAMIWATPSSRRRWSRTTSRARGCSPIR